MLLLGVLTISFSIGFFLGKYYSLIWLPVYAYSFLLSLALMFSVTGISNVTNQLFYLLRIRRWKTAHDAYKENSLIGISIFLSLIVCHIVVTMYLAIVGTSIWMYLIGDHAWPLYITITFIFSGATIGLISFWLTFSLSMRWLNRQIWYNSHDYRQSR